MGAVCLGCDMWGLFQSSLFMNKVRHPGVEEQIFLDFRIMKAVGRFVDALPAMGWLNLEVCRHVVVTHRYVSLHISGVCRAQASMQQFSRAIAS